MDKHVWQQGPTRLKWIPTWWKCTDLWGKAWPLILQSHVESFSCITVAVKWYWNVVPEHKLTLTETIFLEEFRRGLHYRIATESISHRFFNNCSTTGYNKKGQCARTKPHLSNMSVLLGDTPSQNWHQHMHGTQQITFEQHVPCFLASHRQMSKIVSPSLSFPLFPSPVLESVSSRTHLLFPTLPVCAWSFSVTPTI